MIDDIGDVLQHRPKFYRLPPPGKADPHFGLSRSFYYAAEQRCWLKLVRLCAENKRRGVTLVPFREVEAFIAKQGKAQMEGMSATGEMKTSK